MKTRMLLATSALGVLCATGVAAVTVSSIPGQCVLETAGQGSFEFTVTDAGPFGFGVTVISGDPSLIPQNSISGTIMGSSVTITYGVASRTGETVLEILISSLGEFIPRRPVVRVVPPLTIVCPSPIEVPAHAGSCGAPVVFSTPAAPGGCGEITVTCDPPSGSIFALGTTSVTCTAQSGTSAASCTFAVTVTEDELAPLTLACPEDILVPLPPGELQVPVYYPLIVVESCGIVGQECFPPSGSLFKPGTTVVQCAALDATGQAAACAFSVTIETPLTSNKCPVGKGYWKNYEEWPGDELELGHQLYSKAELLAILHSPAEGDASVILASHLIPALLNLLNGSDRTLVAETLTGAIELLAGLPGKLPFQVEPSSSLGHQMIVAAAGLEEYNEGWLTLDCIPF